MPKDFATQSGVELGSAFQPILSFTHGRQVGWEALLRAWRGPERSPASPEELFSQLPIIDLDIAALGMHLETFPPYAGGWLFLNVHPETVSTESGLQAARSAIARSARPPSSIVVEILEAPFFAPAALTRAVESLRSMGCLIAIDDFGAGDSNFERIFELRPEVVKFDRRVVQRAARSREARRVIEQMVSLIHECGCLVLMEGVESEAEAHTALCCDADLAQGWFFGRPQGDPLDRGVGVDAVAAAWRVFDSTPPDLAAESHAAHLQAIELATVMLSIGRPMAEACAHFLSLGGSEMCYLLDERGRQVASNVFRKGLSHRALGAERKFEPLHDTRGSRWARRPYFQTAMRSPNAVQLSRPYLTLQGSRMCRTVSMSFRHDGEARVLCGDVLI